MNKKELPNNFGYYTPTTIAKMVSGELGAFTQRKDGDWEPVRPVPYYSLFARIRFAWDVLTYKSDPLYWYFEKGWSRDKNGMHAPTTSKDTH